MNHSDKPTTPTPNGFNWSEKQYSILQKSYGFTDEEIGYINVSDAQILIGNEITRFTIEQKPLKREKPYLNGKGQVFPPPVSEYISKRGKPKK